MYIYIYNIIYIYIHIYIYQIYIYIYILYQYQYIYINSIYIYIYIYYINIYIHKHTSHNIPWKISTDNGSVFCPTETAGFCAGLFRSLARILPTRCGKPAQCPRSPPCPPWTWTKPWEEWWFHRGTWDFFSSKTGDFDVKLISTIVVLFPLVGWWKKRGLICLPL